MVHNTQRPRNNRSKTEVKLIANYPSNSIEIQQINPCPGVREELSHWLHSGLRQQQTIKKMYKTMCFFVLGKVSLRKRPLF